MKYVYVISHSYKLMHIHIIQYYMLCIYLYCLECQHAHRYMNHKWIPYKFIGTHRPFDPPEALDPNFVAEIYFTLAFLRLFRQGHHCHHCHRWQFEAFLDVAVHPWRATKRKSTEITQNPKPESRIQLGSIIFVRAGFFCCLRWHPSTQWHRLTEIRNGSP